MAHERDWTTGRFIHEWGFQGFDMEGNEWSSCDNCQQLRINGEKTRKQIPEITYQAPPKLCPGVLESPDEMIPQTVEAVERIKAMRASA